jgi:peptidoglycan/LPS O-acetylase OafA/YrhL
VKRLGYRPELDGVRGLAILLVLMAHTLDRRWGFFAGGALGVELFFVLSGFLITSLLLDEWETTGRVSLRGFYVRRIRRLLPALTVLVLGAALVEAWTRSPLSIIVARATVRLSYVVNFVGAIDAHLVGQGFLHLWSLGLEEQFYLAWPLAFALLLRRGVGHRRLLLLLVLAAVLINVNRLVWIPIGDWRRVNYLPDTHGDAIVYGCVAAFLWRRRSGIVPPGVAIAAAAVMLGMVAWFRETSTAYLTLLPVFAVAAAVFVVAALETPSFGRLLQQRWLGATGRLSYSLYLWHLPLIVALGPALGLATAVPASVLSYHLVEQPFRRGRTLRRRPELMPGPPLIPRSSRP